MGVGSGWSLLPFPNGSLCVHEYNEAQVGVSVGVSRHSYASSHT